MNIGVFTSIFFTILLPYIVKLSGENKTQALNITWQRLVDEDGKTCDRCGTTENSVMDAVEKLRRSLKELDINVVLDKKILNTTTFLKDPLESNRIWISGEPIEKWLSATSSQSKCCSACGDSDCRTLIIDGKTYEAIPTELIVKAGLLASAQLLQNDKPSECCSTNKSCNKDTSSCQSSNECQK